jgi:glycosyltransferase involved in cell wall biosynthesis
VLVSILIVNYNYGRFLADAIDSALGQTHPHCEVVVVDDGSTDDSQEVIARYGNRVVAAVKENGGHGSAFNAAFAASRGDTVCLLDSDDVFTEDKVACVVEAFEREPSASIVYHQLQHVDSDLRPLGKPWPRVVVSGDISDKIVRSGGWWPRAGTCADAFPRWFLDRVLPMPEADYRQSADSYLVGLAPFCGKVVGLRRPLALYRMHGQNDSQLPTREEQLRYKLYRTVTDVNGVRRALEDRLRLDIDISLEDNFRYHHLRWALGEEPSPRKMLLTLATTPSMPLRTKAEFLARLLARKW